MLSEGALEVVLTLKVKPQLSISVSSRYLRSEQWWKKYSHHELHKKYSYHTGSTLQVKALRSKPYLSRSMYISSK